MSHVPTVLKSDRSVFDKMLPVDDNGFGCFIVSASASALYSVGLVTALYTGERERRCLVTPCESVSKALDSLSANNSCIQLVPFNYSPHKE